MTNKDYQKHAKVTCNSLDSEKLDLSHMILGMMSELNEVTDAHLKGDATNIHEEYADILFYVFNYATFRNIDLGSLIEINKNLFSNKYELSYYISKLSDKVKKYVAYNKPLDSIEEQYDLLSIYFSVADAVENSGFRMEYILERNIAKLKARYGDKFTEHAAIHRDTTAERKILEGQM